MHDAADAASQVTLRSPLHEAAELGQLELVKALLQKGLQPETVDSKASNF